MSDNDDKLDELFRSRFEDVELPVSDKLLANIKQELGKSKRKRRFGFWLWIASAVAVIAGVSGFVMYKLNDNKGKNSNKIAVVSAVDSSRTPGVESEGSPKEIVVETNTEQTSSNKLNEGIVENTNSHNAEKELKLSEEKNDGIKNLRKDESSKNDQLKGTAEGLTKSVGSQMKKNKMITAENKPSVLSSGKTNSGAKEKSISQKKGENVQAKASSEKSDTPEKQLVKKAMVQEKSSEILSKTDDTTSTLINIVKKTEEKGKPVSEQSNSTGTNKSTYLDSIALKTDTAVIAEVKTNADTLKPLEKEDPSKETTQQKKVSFFMEVNGGPSRSFRSFAPEGNNHVQYKGTEEPLLGYNAGIDVGILFKNKYQVTAGVGIDNKGEKYQFQGQDALFETMNYTVIGWDSMLVWDSTIMDTVWVYDTTYTEVADTQQVQAAMAAKNAKNKYQYLKIPVMFGYRFNINDNWFITPSVGVIVNYLISGSSTWFDSESQEFITYSSRDKYRSFVLAGRAKLDIGLNINNKWSVLVQPGYTRFFQSIYRKEESFKHYPYSYDLNVGVRYTFQ